MERFVTQDECGGYQTVSDPTNTPAVMLIAGSQNVLVDQQRKVKSRAGYTRLGAANPALTPIKYQAPTWNTSSGAEYPMRPYDINLEAYLATVDGVDIDTWTQIFASLTAAKQVRFATWFDATEDQDLLLFVNGDANVFEWGGGVAVVSSSSLASATVTKKGTTTFAQNRFYTTRNKTLICVRTGTEYTYTAGESSTTLTGLSTSGSFDLVDGDILVQKVVTTASTPAAGRTNDVIFMFNNQIYIGSESDNLGYISKNTSYVDYTYSTPRLSGEGGLLTLDSPIKGFGTIGNNIVIFCGRSSMFAAGFSKLAVPQSAANAIISEQLDVKKINAGVDQSAQSQETIIPIGNALMYLSFEPALRIIKNPSDVAGIDPETFSNPIKPDFDGIDWTGACLLWFKNAAYLSAPTASRLYILEFIQDANGRTRRFWQAPQVLPVSALAIIGDALHGHSNAVPETYALFDGGADGDYTDIATEDRIPFKAIAFFAYSFAYVAQTRGKSFLAATRSVLKNFDQYYSEGEIAPGTVITLELLYDFGGSTQIITKTINGADTGIVQEDLNLSSLGQSSFGTQPIGGSSVEPSIKFRYKVIFDVPREDYYLLGERYTTEAVDSYFAVLSRGPNAQMSRRRDPLISR